MADDLTPQEQPAQEPAAADEPGGELAEERLDEVAGGARIVRTSWSGEGGLT